jgi:hypothetical protein
MRRSLTLVATVMLVFGGLSPGRVGADSGGTATLSATARGGAASAHAQAPSAAAGAEVPRAKTQGFWRRFWEVIRGLFTGSGPSVPGRPSPRRGFTRSEAQDLRFDSLRFSSELLLRLERTSPDVRKILAQRAAFVLTYSKDPLERANADKLIRWLRRMESPGLPPGTGPGSGPQPSPSPSPSASPPGSGGEDHPHPPGEAPSPSPGTPPPGSGGDEHPYPPGGGTAPPGSGSQPPPPGSGSEPGPPPGSGTQPPGSGGEPPGSGSDGWPTPGPAQSPLRVPSR